MEVYLSSRMARISSTYLASKTLFFGSYGTYVLFTFKYKEFWPLVDQN